MDLLIDTLTLRPYVFAFMAAFLVLALHDLGRRRTVAFTASTLGVAWTAEFVSTRVGFPFGLYYYTGVTRSRELYLSNVPVFDPVSFVFLAYASYCLSRLMLGRARGLPVVAASAVFMMLLDVVIDPLAVRGDRWFLGRVFYYPDGGAYFGVPLSNFAGWWLVGSVAIAVYMACGALTGARAVDRLATGIALYYGVLGFNLALTGWIGEWRVLATGLALHAMMACVLGMIARRTPAPGVLGTEGMQGA